MTHISPEQTIVLAKLRHIEELENLSICTELIETIGLMIHQLQAERGASCLYIASAGKRLARERSTLIAQNVTLADKLNTLVQQHLNGACATDAKQLTLISWILLGLEQLTSFRHQVTLMKISFTDCIQSYTRLIGSLISLIFEISDSNVNSKISSDLVALYNLVQGKEFAGQERAVGSYLFGSGAIQLTHQQKLMALVELQDRHFEAFVQFAADDLKHSWTNIERSATSQQYQSLRAILTSRKDQQPLNVNDADTWFDTCSQRLTEMWELQCQLIHQMHATLNALTVNAKLDLENTRSHLNDLKHKTPLTAEQGGTFFNLSIPIENAFWFQHDDTLHTYPMESIIDLLKVQSQQIAHIETELFETKKALAERKRIEHAKGLIMKKMNISEVDAYKVLRNTAMEQNRKVIDVAENVIALAKHGIET